MTTALDLYQEGVRLHKQQKLDEAERCYREFLRLQPAHADCLHQLGALLVQKHGAKQYKEALQLVQSAIQLAPANARYRHSLGVVHEAAEQWLSAADAFERALEKRPNDVQARMHLARVLKAAGRPARAAEVYRSLLQLQPDHPSAHYKLGSVLKQLGKHEAAAEAYRQHLQLVPGHVQAAFWLAALTANKEVAACPPQLVADLFDQYSDHFDEHLLEKLQYRTPAMLMECILQAAASTGSSNGSSSSKQQQIWDRCVDLGCGTGLMGPLLRPHTGYLAGVDLSKGMVQKARERGCYDELAVGELGQFLSAAAAAVAAQGVAPYELYVAADVFVYLGDLLPVLEAAAAAASDRALMAFSTELLKPPATSDEEEHQPAGQQAAHSQGSTRPCTAYTQSSTCSSPSADECRHEAGQGKAASAAAASAREVNVSSRCQQATHSASAGTYMLQTTGRYAHSPQYLREVAAVSGWRVLLLQEAHIRSNAGAPIWGSLCVLQRHC